jgi:hypothetical protein
MRRRFAASNKTGEKNRPKSLKKRASESFLLGIAYGLGQALGLTIIFALIFSYLGRLINALGGIPYLGGVLANLVSATQKALGNIK